MQQRGLKHHALTVGFTAADGLDRVSHIFGVHVLKILLKSLNAPVELLLLHPNILRL